MVVIVLHFVKKFGRKGQQKFWVRYGIEDYTRYIPIDFMYAGYSIKSKTVSKKCNRSKVALIQEVSYFL